MVLQPVKPGIVHLSVVQIETISLNNFKLPVSSKVMQEL